ncbi:MAG: hypothetical protein ACTSVI_10545 [Promethearchaeota archaeon]
MHDSLADLQEIIRSRFDLGIKNQRVINEHELEISARDDKLLEVIDFLSRECDARLVQHVINDYGKQLELIHVVILDHLKALIRLKSGIDVRDKKTRSLWHLFTSSRWLEKHDNVFKGINFIEGDNVDSGIKKGNNKLIEDMSLPWTRFEVDDLIEKKSYHSLVGVFDPRLDYFSYLWVKKYRNRISRIKCQVGHLHENLINFSKDQELEKIPYLLSRVCTNDKFHYLLGFSLAMEKLNGMQNDVPELPSYWRLIACELERVKNHHDFLNSWLSIHGQSALLEKNKLILSRLMKLIGTLFKNDDDVPFILPGGISHDPLLGAKINLDDILEWLKSYESDLQVFLIKPFLCGTILNGYDDIGIVKGKDALSAGLSGPSLRASGIPFDVRKDFPYSTYNTNLLKFDVFTGISGDVSARIQVHVHELLESLRIIYQLLSLIGEMEVKTKDSDVSISIGDLKTFSDSLVLVESSRGALLTYVKTVNSEKKLHTLSIQSPSYLNFTSMETLFHDIHVKSLPLIVHSFNPCWNCIDT